MNEEEFVKVADVFGYEGYVNTQPEGTYIRIPFKNGFSASVVRNLFSYGHENGLWEMALIQTKSGKMVKGFRIHKYIIDFPDDDSVVGYLNEESVKDILNQMSMLPRVLE